MVSFHSTYQIEFLSCVYYNPINKHDRIQYLTSILLSLNTFENYSVNPSSPGAVAGITGAGGPSGAVLFGLGFRQLPRQTAFRLMAGAVIWSSFLSLLIKVRNYRGLLFGRDEVESAVKPATLTVPMEPAATTTKDVAEKEIEMEDTA